MQRKYGIEKNADDFCRASLQGQVSHLTSPKKGPKGPRPETTANKAAFLVAYREMGVVRYAARAVGIARETAHRWRREDEAFAQQFDQARADAADNLQAEAMRRAVEGIDRPVIHRGQLATAWVDGDGNYVPEGSPRGVRIVPLTIREYSDTLLIFLLKAARPERYRKRRHSSVERHPTHSPLDVLPGGRGTDDPTIRRLTAEIFAVLERNEVL